MTDNKTVTLMRTRDQWAKCDPEAMCHMSQAAIFHALNDAKHDVLAMHDAILDAAPAPAAQNAGQEAAVLTDKQILTIAVHHFKDGYDSSPKALAAFCDCVRSVMVAYAAPVNGGERELGQVIDERDQYHDAAEKLADAIAKHFGVEIGEHSNLNCPWQNALDHIAQATKRAADAQQVDRDEHANRYRVEKASGGFWPNAVRCGTGTRELFVGHKKQCERVAAELKTAFEDGRFVERTAALTSPAKVGTVAQVTPEEQAEINAALDRDDELACSSRALAAAKVGGDEREAFKWPPMPAFPQALLGSKEGGYLFTEHQMQSYANAYGEIVRAALSADSGEDKRDAERLDWLMQHVCADEIEGIRSLPYGIDMDEYLHLFREAIDAAIAANQARKGE